MVKLEDLQSPSPADVVVSVGIPGGLDLASAHPESAGPWPGRRGGAIDPADTVGRIVLGGDVRVVPTQVYLLWLEASVPMPVAELARRAAHIHPDAKEMTIAVLLDTGILLNLSGVDLLHLLELRLHLLGQPFGRKDPGEGRFIVGVGGDTVAVEAMAFECLVRCAEGPLGMVMAGVGEDLGIRGLEAQWAALGRDLRSLLDVGAARLDRTGLGLDDLLEAGRLASQARRRGRTGPPGRGTRTRHR